MTRKLVSIAVSGVLAAAAGIAPAPVLAQNAEIEALKQQLAALSSKIEALEKAQAQTRKTVDEAQATADKTADVVAQGRAALSFSGDLRYRNESFDVEYVEHNRNRDRVRARFNANFRVNDTLSGRIGIATGGTDPRSSNQTLTDQNSRKDFELDTAYVTWAPTPALKITAGKQPYAWTRTGSLFYDGDVNPEGISLNYAKGNFFAGVFYDWLAERALSFGNVTTGANTDSIMFGAQVGYRIPISNSVRLTLAGTSGCLCGRSAVWQSPAIPPTVAWVDTGAEQSLAAAAFAERTGLATATDRYFDTALLAWREMSADHAAGRPPFPPARLGHARSSTCSSQRSSGVR